MCAGDLGVSFDVRVAVLIAVVWRLLFTVVDGVDEVGGAGFDEVQAWAPPGAYLAVDYAHGAQDCAGAVA